MATRNKQGVCSEEKTPLRDKSEAQSREPDFIASVYRSNPFDEAYDESEWVADIGPIAKKEAKFEAARLAISGYWTTVLNVQTEEIIMSLAPGGDSN